MQYPSKQVREVPCFTHCWLLDGIVNCLLQLAIVVSSVKIGVEMQISEEVKVKILPSP